MKNTPQNVDLPWLMKTYFSEPAKHRILQQGEILMEQGGFNNRLYLVLSGTLAAYVRRPDKSLLRLFESTEKMFVGIYSFFSRTFVSSATVVAETECKVAYIEQNQILMPHKENCCLFEQFMPVVVVELLKRQQREQEAALDKEKTLKKLIESEKLASLGQMAAGIAHELNNAISVLQSNTNWLVAQLNEFFEQQQADEYFFFNRGEKESRKISSREIRTRSRELMQQLGIAEPPARKIAEMGWTTTDFSKEWLSKIDQLHHYWEIGAVLHDMKIASKHAAHVVKSVKDLATSDAVADQPVDINQTLTEALALLSSPLRKINVQSNLAPVPLIQASRGALVQVWMNLIKNALESLDAHQNENPTIKISSKHSRQTILVKISDNGPGIPFDELSKIFQPNFTTKEKGLDFGLGLGLTIVARIINRYDGTIHVESQPGNTTFTVKLPIKGEYGETSNRLH